MDSFALPAPKQKSTKPTEEESSKPKSDNAEFKAPSSVVLPVEVSPENSIENEIPPPPPLNYQKPDWSGLPTQKYHFEVIKGGLMIETLEVSTDKDFLVVGRLPFCDISLEHPSVSRYHAIIQFQKSGEIYLFDLKSAQGTRVNKQAIAPRKYHRIRIGDQIRFGQSTRLFVLQGLEEDTPAASELQPNRNGEEYVGRALPEDITDEERLLPLDDPQYIEDENIFYRKDPKKALKNFLENQGEEMEFEVEEEGTGEDRMYIARVKLPLFESATYGIGKDFKKKDAEKLAALDACIRLDKMGILRNSNETELAKRRNRMKELLGDDGSDDDSFYDRTGAVGKSKKKRSQKKGGQTVETYESLNEKKSELQAKIEALSNKIVEGTIQEGNHATKNLAEDDDLDEYMASLSRDIKGKDIDILKKQLQDMQMELQKLERLIEIAKPTDLFASLSTKAERSPQTTKANSSAKASNSSITEIKNPVISVADSAPTTETSTPQNTEIHTPKLPYLENTEVTELPSSDAASVSVQNKRPSSESTSVQSKRRQFYVLTREEYEASNKTVEETQEVESEEEIVWQPPEGQTGDGKTALNAKFGY